MNRSSTLVVVPDEDDAETRFRALDDLLWQERRLLERLQFRLRAQLALVRLRETRWLRVSDSEVTAALRDLARHEVARAMVTDKVLSGLGLARDATLRDVAAAAPAPWNVMFDDHRDALRAMELDIREVASSTADLLDAPRSGVR